ncbi:MAG: phytanoyl-CoA dioxygenase family protein [bacterium]
MNLPNSGVLDPYPTRGQAPARIKRQEPVVVWPERVLTNRRHQLERFERNGFLFLPKLFQKQEVKELLEEAQRLRERAQNQHFKAAFFEAGAEHVRSVFAVHQMSDVFKQAFTKPEVLDLVTDILGDEVYLHQTRLNYKPAFEGREFYWHSDFETWHAEDGMPRMKAVSLCISLTPSLTTNGPLMLIPGSHEYFVSCVGRTPENHFKQSLVKQRYGTPDKADITWLAQRRGIKAPVGAAGSALIFDCNTMHGSCGNITPFSRINLFAVYNAVSNALQEPFCGTRARPESIATREITKPLTRHV